MFGWLFGKKTLDEANALPEWWDDWEKLKSNFPVGTKFEHLGQVLVILDYHVGYGLAEIHCHHFNSVTGSFEHVLFNRQQFPIFLKMIEKNKSK